ncbi:udp-glucose 4-epimerase [Lasius niger]|uniref:Udp-glucose 4-epimerase n=1 Tax=Lasius niger TaxID=67767 RepID=A0A0J7K3Z8_LASNI|nr:udp-glucose 4-epimerase [Lasius niger]
MGMEKKQERAYSCHYTPTPCFGNAVKTYFLQIACDKIQVRLQDSDEEKKTETVLEQPYDKIEAETDDIEEIPIADYMEEIPICEVSLGSHDEKLAEPGPSGTAKRMRMH